MSTTSCIECIEGMSVEDIIRKVIVCDESGNVSFRLKIVEDEDTCLTCSENFLTLEDILRKSIYCDEDGLWYIRVTATE